MFLAGHPSQGCFSLQSHCAPCYFFNQASFYPSDFSFSLETFRSKQNVPKSTVATLTKKSISRTRGRHVMSSSLLPLKTYRVERNDVQ
ncbi:hypothetical protein TNCV_3395861 [Trichonephila clavipes]|nr:hypothetical protein TNCV_3395861 [Trichonephila clavipes]